MFVAKGRTQLGTPIAHMVPRDPDYGSDGDSSLTAAGGFSIGLRFWWHLIWPAEIQARNIREMKRDKDGKLISINMLEYATVLMNYAASTVAIQELEQQGKLKHKYPVVLIKADNTAAESWTKKASSSSLSGKALMRLQCAMMIQNPIGINAEWIEGIKNKIPDYISRFKKQTNKLCDFDHLKQVFPELTCCCRFQPSKKLLSMIYDAVLNHAFIDPTKPLKKLGQFETE
jgi:hypothetical protein